MTSRSSAAWCPTWRSCTPGGSSRLAPPSGCSARRCTRTPGACSRRSRHRSGAELLTGIEGQQPRPGRRGAGCSFAPRCSFAEVKCHHETPVPVIIEDRIVRCLRAPEISAGSQPRPAMAARRGPSGAAAVLSLRGLSASYGANQVLFKVGLDVPAESCLAVVGESGSGKTTLARCIVGLHRDWAGEMTFAGADPGARARGSARRTCSSGCSTSSRTRTPR